MDAREHWRVRAGPPTSPGESGLEAPESSRGFENTHSMILNFCQVHPGATAYVGAAAHGQRAAPPWLPNPGLA